MAENSAPSTAGQASDLSLGLTIPENVMEQNAELDECSLPLIRNVRCTIADLFHDVVQIQNEESDIHTKEFTQNCQNFMGYFKSCLKTTPNIFLPHIGLDDEAGDEANSTINLRYNESSLCSLKQGFSNWIYNVLGYIMVTSNFRAIHDAVRELIEELFDIMSHEHTAIVHTGLRTLLRIISRVDNTWLISCNGGESFLKPDIDFPDVLLINMMQIIYKYWHFIDVDDVRARTELVIGVLAVLQSDEVETEDKAPVLKGFPAPFYAATENCQLLHVKIISEILKLDGIHAFESTNQFLCQFYLYEIREYTVERCAEFYLSLELFLGKFIAAQLYNKPEIDRKGIIKMYQTVHDRRADNALQLLYQVVHPTDALDLADKFLANFPYALRVLGDSVVIQLHDFLKEHDYLQMRALSEDWYISSGTFQFRRACVDLALCSTIWRRLREKWTLSAAHHDAKANPRLNFDQHTGLFALAVAVRKRLYTTEVMGTFKAKIAEFTQETPTLIFFDCRIMTVWISSIYRDMSRAKTLGQRRDLISQFIKCVHLLSSLNTPHDEMFYPGHLKDLIRILVAPWHKFGSTNVWEMNSKVTQNNADWINTDNLDDEILTSRRFGALSLRIFNSERSLVREVLQSAVQNKDRGCITGLMHFFSKFHNALNQLGISENNLLALFERATDSTGLQFLQLNPTSGELLAKSLARLPCIVSIGNFPSYSPTHPTGTRFHGCPNCDNQEFCQDSLVAHGRLSQVCSDIFSIASDEMKLCLTDLLENLRRHGSRPHPQINAVFANNCSKLGVSHDVRVKILEGLEFFMNNRVVNMEFEGGMRLILAALTENISRKGGGDFQGEIYYILDALESLATGTSAMIVRNQIAKFVMELLKRRRSHSVVLRCRGILRYLASERGCTLTTLMKHVKMGRLKY